MKKFRFGDVSVHVPGIPEFCGDPPGVAPSDPSWTYICRVKSSRPNTVAVDVQVDLSGLDRETAKGDDTHALVAALSYGALRVTRNYCEANHAKLERNAIGDAAIMVGYHIGDEERALVRADIPRRIEQGWDELIRKVGEFDPRPVLDALSVGLVPTEIAARIFEDGQEE